MTTEKMFRGNEFKLTVVVASLFVLSWSASGYAVSSSTTIDSDAIDAALASPVRTDEDCRNDESRRPDQFLQFIGLNRGDIVAEINAGQGYYARIYPDIVGKNGHVFVTNAEFILVLFDGIQDRLGD